MLFIALAAAVLAVGCLLRDTTLERIAKILRIVVVLVVPVVASLFVLRGTQLLRPKE